MSRRIELHVHSYSLRFHLRYREQTGYDVFAYMAEMAAIGFTGVNVSANGPGYRDLCGTTPDHFSNVRAAAREHGLRLELDRGDNPKLGQEGLMGGQQGEISVRRVAGHDDRGFQGLTDLLFLAESL